MKQTNFHRKTKGQKRGGNRGSGRGTKGEEEPEKGEEMEVKDKIEETKDEKGIKGTTLKTKITETDHEIEHNCPGRQLPWETTAQEKEILYSSLYNYSVLV